MAPVRPNRDLCVPLQTKTRPRPLADTTRNGSCLPDACFALHTIAPAAHDANKASNTKNGRARNPETRGSGLGRIISEKTFVSRSQARGVFTLPARR